ncbi:hypothetical protein LCGC14_0372840 [marine sediment metagenome]|uniref:Uncharacterized protein n=1 Tax=marine sediment metagenome TaxID=412755 RepID=A0A0F9WDF1_9ZZZZ
MPSSLLELSAKLDEMNAKADENDQKYKDAMEKKDKDHKEAMDDMEKKNHDAMEDEHKKTEDANKAMEDDKEHHDAVLKAVLKAMEEPDEEKRATLLKAAMEIPHKDDEHTQTAKNGDHEMKEMKEENKSMKAQLDYQNTIIKKPKLQILEAAYESHVDKKTLAEYTADWNKMTPEQLDGAIEKAKPIIELSGRTIETTPTPLGLSQGLSEFTGSAKSGNGEYSAKVDKMTPEELFAR